jgi:membrane-bound lytic murein transglycosylase D
MEKPNLMNVFKLFLLACVLYLTGCATAPAPSQRSSAAPVADASRTSSNAGSSARGDSLALSTSRELQSSGRPAGSGGEPSPLSFFSNESPSRNSVVHLSAPADLWERIRRGYGMPDLDHDLVHDREQWYANRPDYIFRMTERSKKYLFHIVEELEVRNMPTELALLPFIESAFNPQAVSSARAAGIWQFMPATGKYFELKQNVFRDDRRDVLASTRAALDYMQKLYRMFGDWHLALAAYNWGEGSVGRAIAKNQRAGLPTAYTDLNMPMETRMYVPKLQAVKNIIAAPEKFNSNLPHIDNHPYFQSVSIRRDIDLALAAKLAQVPLEDFKALNPSINKPVILAAGTPQILLPWDNAEVFQRNFEAYTGGRMATWTVWVAPTTLRTAEVAKRVGMSETELRAVNNIPPKVVIKAGSSLLVPRASSMRQDVTEKIADNGQISTAPEVVLKRTTVRAGKGETVASIARKYKVTPANVAQWNKVSTSDSFKAGRHIILFLPPKAPVKAQPSKAQPAKTQTAKGKQAQTAKR